MAKTKELEEDAVANDEMFDEIDLDDDDFDQEIGDVDFTEVTMDLPEEPHWLLDKRVLDGSSGRSIRPSKPAPTVDTQIQSDTSEEELFDDF